MSLQLNKLSRFTFCRIAPCRLERSDFQAQAESLRKQTLATLSERDQQIRQLGAMLETTRSSEPKLLQEHVHKQVKGNTPELCLSSISATYRPV